MKEILGCSSKLLTTSQLRDRHGIDGDINSPWEIHSMPGFENFRIPSLDIISSPNINGVIETSFRISLGEDIAELWSMTETENDISIALKEISSRTPYITPISRIPNVGVQFTLDKSDESQIKVLKNPNRLAYGEIVEVVENLKSVLLTTPEQIIKAIDEIKARIHTLTGEATVAA